MLLFRKILRAIGPLCGLGSVATIGRMRFQAAEQFAAKREILPIQTGGEMRNLTVDEILYL